MILLKRLSIRSALPAETAAVFVDAAMGSGGDAGRRMGLWDGITLGYGLLGPVRVLATTPLPGPGNDCCSRSEAGGFAMERRA